VRDDFLRTVYESGLRFYPPQNHFWRRKVSVHVSGERERLRASESVHVSESRSCDFLAKKIDAVFAEQAGKKNGLP
jgi:hypothetical protein